ncbi:hypothetical protein [Alienimonas chondri]|uniref:Uncharacterized protein n=1 Tax=Alienimonas chondri TaxID=2681879 RepID=A0ABX1VB57_9PLAN|nr:hypothetical protein [Alienimonas chondri]NNJ25345.1 hypothetical protein [Alienimonas chondri]
MVEPVAEGTDSPEPTEPGSDDGESPEPASEEPESEEPADDAEGDENAAAGLFQAAGFASLPMSPQDETETPQENGEENPAGEQPPAESPEEASAETAEEPADEEMTEEESPAEETATDGLAAEETAAEEPATEELAAEEPAMEAPQDETAADESDAEPPAPTADDEGDGDEAAPPAPKPEEFLPLDPARREAIRARLKREAVSEEMTRRINAARDAMYVLGEEVWANVPNPEDPTVELSEEEVAELRTEARATIAQRMEAYAKKNGLTYKRLPFLSYPELVEGEEGATDDEKADDETADGDEDEEENDVGRESVGAAMAPSENQFQQSGLAIDPLAANLRSPLFSDVRIGETPGGTALFAIWKADQRFAEEQELTDDGVREQVVEAFKLQKAAEAAAARADVLAKQASEEGKTLKEVVEGQTVTGKKDGTPLKVTETGSFLRLRVNRPSGIQAFIQGPTPVRNPVPTMENGVASEEFLDAAFDTLEPGEAAGVPGAQPDRSLVVELISREPTDERLSELYETFLQNAREDPRLYQQAGDEVRGAAINAFVTGLFDKYGVDREAIGALSQDQ